MPRSAVAEHRGTTDVPSDDSPPLLRREKAEGKAEPRSSFNAFNSELVVKLAKKDEGILMGQFFPPPSTPREHDSAVSQALLAGTRTHTSDAK